MPFNIVKLLAMLGLAAIILVPTSPSSWAHGARQSQSVRAQARAFNANAAFNPRVNSRSRRGASAGEWTAIHGAGP
jgi:hypothetical protein